MHKNIIILYSHYFHLLAGCWSKVCTNIIVVNKSASQGAFLNWKTNLLIYLGRVGSFYQRYIIVNDYGILKTTEQNYLPSKTRKRRKKYRTASFRYWSSTYQYNWMLIFFLCFPFDDWIYPTLLLPITKSKHLLVNDYIRINRCLKRPYQILPDVLQWQLRWIRWRISHLWLGFFT